ncbi:hypothetical protein M3148_08665 [Georgenia satyanarayanai]|uniref:DUF6541 family protein n=1 Tax=Georgenia satyanarayanai TaxID=860221 RepID=UPI00203D9BEA|nr:DUF6541 family protein [Georgenia satyanarayanai]MCM3661062.1 hypothetical protein [Georgenia satyanarayanai]
MSWSALLPGAVVLAGLAVAPGALMLRALGVRGLAALAAAAPVTVGAVGLLSIVLAPLGVAWRLPTVLAGLAVLLGLTWVLGRPGRGSGDARVAQPAVAGTPGRLTGRRAAAVGIALVASFVLLAAPFVAALPSADAPLQQWDAVFHLNAVVAIRDTGVATPLGGLAPLYGDGTLAPYYPTGWHSLLAIAPGFTSVAAVTNAGVLVLGVAVWLVGLAGLAREVFTGQSLPAVLAPLLAAGFVAYPAVQLTVLAQFAQGLSTALLPGALLLVLRAVRTVTSPVGAWVVVRHAVAALAAVAGVLVAHAGGAFSLAVVAGPLVAGAVVAWAVRLVRAGRVVLATGAALALVGVVVAGPVVAANLDALSAVVGFERASGRTHAAALGEVLLDQTLVHAYPYDGRWQHLAPALAVVAGAVLLLVRRQHRWLVVAYALGVALAVLAAGPEEHPLRWLTGFWYTQAARIAAFTVVPAVLLAACSTSALTRWLQARTGRRVAVAVTLVLVLACAGVRLPLQERVVASAYVPGELAWGTMATEDELALMRRAGRTLPPDAVVVGDPFNGSALLPALAGVDVVFPQLGTSGTSDAQTVLRERLVDIHMDPAVCAAIEDVGATHLYQDTASAVDGAKTAPQTAGMRDVDVSAGFTEIDSAGTATLSTIEVCD